MEICIEHPSGDGQETAAYIDPACQTFRSCFIRNGGSYRTAVIKFEIEACGESEADDMAGGLIRPGIKALPCTAHPHCITTLNLTV